MNLMSLEFKMDKVELRMMMKSRRSKCSHSTRQIVGRAARSSFGVTQNANGDEQL